jgi:iron complex outermembrane recepter protein
MISRLHPARAVARGVLLLFAAAPMLRAQQPVTPDSARSATRIKEITVTAAPARREAAASSLSLTAVTLRAVPALNPYDRLRQAAGLEVHDQGQGPGFASNASLRGFTSDHSTDLALWIDGVPINEPVNGHAEGYNDWSLMFPQSISSIEIFKGPTSPLYGNFALAGVVNVRTLERMRGVQTELTGGAYGRFEGSLLGGWDRDGSGGVLGLRGLRESGWRPNSGYELGQVHLRAVHDLSPGTAVDAGVELYAAGWDSPGFLTGEQFADRDYRSVSNPTDGGFKHRAQERVSLRALVGSSLLWRSTLYATQGRWQLFLTTPPEGGTTEGSGSQVEEEDRRYGFGGTSALSWSAGHVDATLGVEGRWDHSNYENWFVTFRARDSAETLTAASQASGALFLETHEEIGPHVRLDLGGRLDVRHARDEPTEEPASSDTRALVSPKLGLSIHPSGSFHMYGNVSRGFRQTDGVIRDPRLPFITAWAYEAGLKLFRGDGSASLAVFRMDVSDEQTFNPITATSTSGGSSRRQGVELGLSGGIGPAARLSGEWTFLDAKYLRLVTEDGDTLSGARVFNTAKYVGAVALDLAPPAARWQLHVAGNVVGPYSPFDEPGVTLPAYGLLHLSGGWSLGRAQVQVGLRNVLNHAYPELRAGDFVVPGQPRTVFVGLRYRLGEKSVASRTAHH